MALPRLNSTKVGAHMAPEGSRGSTGGVGLCVKCLKGEADVISFNVTAM
jgi:hypothetical protein